MVTMRRRIITESQLKERIAEINRRLGFDPQQCESGYIVGSYRLDSAYGRHRMIRVLSTGGGIESLSGISGFYTKQELWDKIKFYQP